MQDEYKCEHCNTICKNKHILKSHLIRSKKCLKQRGLSLKSTFVCKGCNTHFASNIVLTEHQNICNEFSVFLVKTEFDKKIEDLEKKHLMSINELEKKYKDEIQMHMQEKSFLEKQLDRVQSSYENVAKDAVNRPTTSNVTIRNILSSDKTIDTLKHEDLLDIFRKYLTEDVLLGGQKAIAKICSENIIHSDDKMLMVCTDTSRDKYKYMDKTGNIKEDFYARNFTSKIIKPLESIGQNVYETACATIAEEREQLSCIEYSKEASLKNKEDRLSTSLFELKTIDVENHNAKFLNELSILTKR